jgi:LysR family transcriptional activator of nhaA
VPGGDSAQRPQLERWFDSLGVRPHVVADFDDTAVMKAFGQAGAGVFPMPANVAEETARQFGVMPVGATDEVIYRTWAVSTERRLTHPAVVAISQAARMEAPRPRAAAARAA